jgi:hypothetical protein
MPWPMFLPPAVPPPPMKKKKKDDNDANYTEEMIVGQQAEFIEGIDKEKEKERDQEEEEYDNIYYADQMQRRKQQHGAYHYKPVKKNALGLLSTTNTTSNTTYGMIPAPLPSDPSMSSTSDENISSTTYQELYRYQAELDARLLQQQNLLQELLREQQMQHYQQYLEHWQHYQQQYYQQYQQHQQQHPNMSPPLTPMNLMNQYSPYIQSPQHMQPYSPPYPLPYEPQQHLPSFPEQEDDEEKDDNDNDDDDEYEEVAVEANDTHRQVFQRRKNESYYGTTQDIDPEFTMDNVVNEVNLQQVIEEKRQTLMQKFQPSLTETNITTTNHTQIENKLKNGFIEAAKERVRWLKEKVKEAEALKEQLRIETPTNSSETDSQQQRDTFSTTEQSSNSSNQDQQQEKIKQMVERAKNYARQAKDRYNQLSIEERQALLQQQQHQMHASRYRMLMEMQLQEEEKRRFSLHNQQQQQTEQSGDRSHHSSGDNSDTSDSKFSLRGVSQDDEEKLTHLASIQRTSSSSLHRSYSDRIMTELSTLAARTFLRNRSQKLQPLSSSGLFSFYEVQPQQQSVLPDSSSSSSSASSSSTITSPHHHSMTSNDEHEMAFDPPPHLNPQQHQHSMMFPPPRLDDDDDDNNNNNKNDNEEDEKADDPHSYKRRDSRSGRFNPNLQIQNPSSSSPEGSDPTSTNSMSRTPSAVERLKLFKQRLQSKRDLTSPEHQQQQQQSSSFSSPNVATAMEPMLHHHPIAPPPSQPFVSNDQVKSKTPSPQLYHHMEEEIVSVLPPLPPPSSSQSIDRIGQVHYIGADLLHPSDPKTRVIDRARSRGLNLAESNQLLEASDELLVGDLIETRLKRAVSRKPSITTESATSTTAAVTTVATPAPTTTTTSTPSVDEPVTAAIEHTLSLHKDKDYRTHILQQAEQARALAREQFAIQQRQLSLQRSQQMQERKERALELAMSKFQTVKDRVRSKHNLKESGESSDPTQSNHNQSNQAMSLYQQSIAAADNILHQPLPPPRVPSPAEERIMTTEVITNNIDTEIIINNNEIQRTTINNLEIHNIHDVHSTIEYPIENSDEKEESKEI